MIPELGHFALILALLVALVQGVLPLVGRRAWQPRLDRRGAARGAGAVPAGRLRLRLPDLGVLRQP
jgi:cytochrome c-type biogenesis protein CcmF